MATAEVLARSLDTLGALLSPITRIISTIPGSGVVYRYVQASYKDDPFRIVLELFLIFFTIRYLFSKRYDPQRDPNRLTSQEMDELVDEWTPEPLVPELGDFEKEQLSKVPVLEGGQGVHLTLEGGQKVTSLVSTDFLGFLNDEGIKEKSLKTLREYGVGACGPPGFYGTLDVHMDLERKLAEHLGAEEAIIYAQGFSTLSSVIPAFSKRGDIIVCDEAVSFPAQRGIQLSRSTVHFYKHNDMDDLKRVLDSIDLANRRKRRTLTRRFIVTEGISSHFNDIVPLPQLVELKNRYKYRLILDESLSFGVLGDHGRGVTEHFNIPVSEVDILTGDMSITLGSSGGFCAGTRAIVDHQRLGATSYVFSAALPAMLTVCSLEALSRLSQAPKSLQQLRENSQAFRRGFGEIQGLRLQGDPQVPMAHLRLDTQEEDCDRMEQEEIMQAIVDAALAKGLLVSRAKYVLEFERDPPPPSVRINLSALLSTQETEEAGKTLRAAILHVLEAA